MCKAPLVVFPGKLSYLLESAFNRRLLNPNKLKSCRVDWHNTHLLLVVVSGRPAQTSHIAGLLLAQRLRRSDAQRLIDVAINRNQSMVLLLVADDAQKLLRHLVLWLKLQMHAAVLVV